MHSVTPATRAWYVRVTAGSVVLVYDISLVMPSLFLQGRPENLGAGGFQPTDYGIGLVLVGFLGCCVANPAWLANPFLWIGTIGQFLGEFRKACILGGLAGGLSLLVWRRFCQNNPEDNIPLMGYYVWVSSQTILLVAGGVGAALFRMQPPHVRPLQPQTSAPTTNGGNGQG